MVLKEQGVSMVVNKATKRLVEKRDFIHITILLLIALGIGVYLIATTVLIADDGVYYIERAQKFSSEPSSVIESHPPGYSYLIFIAHRFAMLFSNSSSVYIWIYSAQSVTLLCRLLAIIPLYFIGKEFVGRKLSFWAILVLIMLPYPAKTGADALRDWPHILFLTTGFLFLLWGVKQGKWWIFGIAGLVAGLGFIIRPECAQLVVYSILWLLVRLLRPKYNMSRPKLLCALFILLIGFALPVSPYVIEAGRIIPPKLRELIDSSKEHVTPFFQAQPEKEVNAESHNRIYTIMSSLGNITKAIGRLVERISENLMYFFVPALLIGIYCRFRKQSSATATERFFVPVFIVLNVITMILLYCSYEYISRRHCLPLVVFSIFYVPIGLQALGNLFSGCFSKTQPGKTRNARLWFFVLIAVGMGICLPKLLRPMRVEKRGYLDAAEWLRGNTAPKDMIAVPDKRIAFYAERKGLGYGSKVPKQAKYVVRIVKDEDKEPKFDRTVQEKFSVWMNKREKKRRIVIYEVL